MIEKAGAKAIAIHGRTRKQMYQGSADWDIIKTVKQEIKSIPIIGNGDIKSPEDAKRAIEEYGVDAVMIGRAVLGNPWLIKQIVTYLDTGEKLLDPTPEEKVLKAIDHLDYLTDLKGERMAVLEMRSHIPWYIKGLRNANSVKRETQELTRADDVKRVLMNYLNEFQ